MAEAFDGPTFDSVFEPIFEYVLPQSAEVQQVADILVAHQAAIEFRREVEHRQAFEDYCEWYYKLAAQNQAEMMAMQEDTPFFPWWRPQSSL